MTAILDQSVDLDSASFQRLLNLDPLMWINEQLKPLGGHIPSLDEAAALKRLQRNAPLLENLFPGFAATGGRLESPLVRCDGLRSRLSRPAFVDGGVMPSGDWWFKRDDLLPVSGSVKTRGAVHEILWHVEAIGARHDLRTSGSEAAIELTEQLKACIGSYTIVVGSTGNLGLAVGLVASGFGFRVVVHMSEEAKLWKKERLRAAGATVVEHPGDYLAAVRVGREIAQNSPNHIFVDDERSGELFLGYAAVAEELSVQFDECGIRVDDDHPLFVYIPCGVGGAPGGITYGLKRRWHRNVHCFFAQSCAFPSLLVRLASSDAGLPVSVYDLGLKHTTEADGLAVPSASELATPFIRKQLSGLFTVDDETLLKDLYLVARAEGMRVEPSAVAAVRGPNWVMAGAQGRDYLARHDLVPKMARANHIIWSTGGLLVPDNEQSQNSYRGRVLSEMSATAARS